MQFNLPKQTLPFFLLVLGLPIAWADALPNQGCSVTDLMGGYNWNERTRTDFSEFGLGIVHAVSVGREIHDGSGKITSGAMTINSSYVPANGFFTYTGEVTMQKNCVGTYRITLDNGDPGGGGTIYMDPITRNFTLLDEFNIGTASFLKDGAGGGLKSLFPQGSWP